LLKNADLVAFLSTVDLRASQVFYGDILGLSLCQSTSYANVYDANGTQLRVTLLKHHVPAQYTVLGFSVPDITATINALAKHDLSPKRYEGMDQDQAGIWTAPSATRVVWFEDPDGNILSFSESRPLKPS
jgi:catechol-2,3-dioxygenase